MAEMRENIELIEDLDSVEGYIPLPTANQSKIVKMESIDERTVKLTAKDELALGLTAIGIQNCTNRGVLDDYTEDELISNPTHNGKSYGVSKVAIKGKPITARTRLGITTPVKVTLYNSGFIYVTNEISQSQENELLITMGELYKKIAIKTVGLSFSSDTLHLDGAVIDFIDKLITNGGMSTLKGLPDGETIWDYISILDLPTIYLGLIKSINPSKFKIVSVCKNVLEIDDIGNNRDPDDKEDIVNENTTDSEVIETSSIEDEEITPTKRVRCNSVIRAEVIPDSLLHVKSNRLELEQLINVRRTVDDLSSYRESVGLVPEKITVNVSGYDIKITINDSSITRYLEINEMILMDIEESVDAIITSEDEQYKKLKELEIFDKNDLLKYIHFIQSIEYPDGQVDVTNREIIDGFTSISKFDNVREELIKAIKNFITKRSISIVGIPEYICESCNRPIGGEEERTGYFKDIIPLNIQNLFFTLYNLK